MKFRNVFWLVGFIFGCGYVANAIVLKSVYPPVYIAANILVALFTLVAMYQTCGIFHIGTVEKATTGTEKILEP